MLTIATYPPMDAGFNSLPSRTMLDAGVFKHPALGSVTRAVRGMSGCTWQRASRPGPSTMHRLCLTRRFARPVAASRYRDGRLLLTAHSTEDAPAGRIPADLCVDSSEKGFSAAMTEPLGRAARREVESDDPRVQSVQLPILQG